MKRLDAIHLASARQLLLVWRPGAANPPTRMCTHRVWHHRVGPASRPCTAALGRPVLRAPRHDVPVGCSIGEGGGRSTLPPSAGWAADQPQRVDVLKAWALCTLSVLRLQLRAASCWKRAHTVACRNCMLRAACWMLWAANALAGGLNEHAHALQVRSRVRGAAGHQVRGSMRPAFTQISSPRRTKAVTAISSPDAMAGLVVPS